MLDLDLDTKRPENGSYADPVRTCRNKVASSLHPEPPSMQTQSKLQSFFSSSRNVIFRRRLGTIVPSNHDTHNTNPSHSAKPQPSIVVPPVGQSPSSLSSEKGVNLQTVSQCAGGQGDVNHKPKDVPQNDAEGVVCEHSATMISFCVNIVALDFCSRFIDYTLAKGR